MSQTLENGIIVAINADAYNLTADLAAMGGSSNVVIPVANATALAALTLTIGTVALRTDTGVCYWCDGTNWNPITPNAGASYAFTSPTNLSCTGTCNVVTLSDGSKRVDIDLTITRTNTTLGLTGATTPQSLGTMLPTQAQGASNTKVLSSYLNGSGQGVTPVQLNVVPSSGVIEIRSQGATTWLVGASATVNCSYRL